MKRFILSSAMMVLAALCSRAAAQTPYRGASLLPVPAGGQQYLASVPQQSWNYAVYSPEDSDSAAPEEEVVGGCDAGSPTWCGEPYGCDGDYCGVDMTGDCCCCSSCWYAGTRALVMTRDEENDIWLSFNTDNVLDNLLSTNQASMEWEPGFEFTVGRYFDCGWALEATYWGIYSSPQYANAYDPAPPLATTPNLNSTLDFSDLSYDNGVLTDTVQQWYDGSLRHRLRRDYEFHNIELNLVRAGFGWGAGCCGTPCCCGLGCSSGRCCSSNLCVDVFAGARFFQFAETFQFATDEGSTTFGDDPEDELYYDIDVDNYLIGFQVGGRAEYQLTCRCSLYAGTKFGLYGNYITHRSRIGGANGVAFVNNGPNSGRDYDIHSNKDDVAMMGEIDLGMAYSFHPQWRATVGYRAVGVSGVALSTNQIPANFADVDGVADIDSNGSLILHGAYCGLEFNW